MEPIKPVRRPLNPQYARSVDGMMRRPVAQPVTPAPIRPQIQTQQTPAQAGPLAAPIASVAKPSRPLPRWKSILQTSIVVVLGIAAGLIFQFLPLGQVAVIIYGIVAIVRRIPSYITFMALLAAFLCLAILTALGHYGLITQNVAIYVFFLFIFGVVSAALELRRASKQMSIQPRKETPIQQALNY